MKDRILLLAAGFILLVIGPNRFHYLGQGSGPLARLAAAFANNHWIKHIIDWHAEYEADVGRDTISETARAQYSGESLGGWGAAGEVAAIRGDRHLPIDRQMRAIALPDIRSMVRATVVEIGTGDGELLALLAAEFPSTKFLGVDLNVDYAKRTHRLPNLQFLAGYAAEMIEAGALKADLVFASSTFVVFTPREMERYVNALTVAGVKQVVIVDPLTRKYRPERFPGTSRHMAKGMWGHDYRHYFGRAGWEVAVETVRYRGHDKIPVALFQKVVARNIAREAVSQGEAA